MYFFLVDREIVNSSMLFLIFSPLLKVCCANSLILSMRLSSDEFVENP